ncbi:MAG: hypothetical protein AAF791_05770 [Bacteroidota bacterium]
MCASVSLPRGLPPPPPTTGHRWWNHDPTRHHLQEVVRGRSLDRARDPTLARDLDRARTLAFSLASGRYRAPDPTPARDLARDLARDRARTLRRTLARTRTLARALGPAALAAFAQEQFFPTIQQSFPRMHLFHLNGQIGHCALVAPAHPLLEPESDSRTLRRFERGQETAPLLQTYAYDLVFPLTAIPLGALRRHHLDLWTDGTRPFRIAQAPFLFPELEHVWPRHASLFQEWLGSEIEGIYAFLPPEELWDTPFEAWTPPDQEDSDWRKGHSAYWHLASGTVRWVRGTAPREQTRAEGISGLEMFPEVLDE